MRRTLGETSAAAESFGRPARASGRIPALDGLRGCAILLVIAGHAAAPLSHTLGAAGVTLFFVLSGYLITNILLQSRPTLANGGLKSFYGKRARRLLPALLLLLLFETTLRIVTGQSLIPVVLAGGYVTNFAAAAGHFSTLTHSWSLALEEQFYLLWPLALPWICRRQRAVWVVLAAAAASIIMRWSAYAWGPWTLAFFHPVTRADAILLGCAVALAKARGWGLPRAGLRVLMTAAAVAIVAAAFVWRSLDAAIGLLPLTALASAALVASAASPEATLDNRVLSISPLRFIGRISYGMYLWHPVALTAVAAIAVGPFRTVAAIGLVMAMATASWFMIERRWLEVGTTNAGALTSEETGRRVRAGA